MDRDQPQSSVREFWTFYRRYTDTAVHTASAAALAIFGLLVFVDPLFVLLAIGSYVLPPVVLYTFRRGESLDDSESQASPDRRPGDPIPTETTADDRIPLEDRQSRRDFTTQTPDPGDTDTETGDGDTDTDTGDTDSDSANGDSDTDADS